MAKQLFAIGDVHGCADELEELLGKLPLGRGDKVVFLGDYVDRGPDSRRVIDLVLGLRHTCEVVALRGNHEDMMLEFLADQGSRSAALFIYNGGSTTLASYADDMGRVDIPREHVEFLRSLPLFHETDGFFFVHAGVPSIPLSEVNAAAHGMRLLWVREPFLNSDYDWGKVIVHGHTPQEEVERRHNRINLDTGCYLGGHLSAMELGSGALYQVARGSVGPRAVLADVDAAGRRRTRRFRGRVDVYLGKDQIHYITEDYSEFGMSVRPASVTHMIRLFSPEAITGSIGARDDTGIRFSGTVVRESESRDGLCYGIQINEVLYPD